ncbi:diaminopimelate decarboxylase [uncultured Microscilla sp.]|uniref:diaminopimelate decarboxylase n=1 Tax=uncultured Microscilla sp. TaxID=432653 RepID=UPI002615999A|nr:diaminopimelate decarboxylase [uncultured Microscilla sp.]
MQRTDNEYYIQRLRVTDIARQFGTPVYVYNADHILGQIARFRKGFSTVNLQIKYACKALTNINIMKLMLSQGLGLDTVSLPEVRMGLAAGFAPQQIVFTPNCVGIEELIEAVELGVKINIENLSNLEKFAQRYGSQVPVCIRLNPHIATQKNADKVNWWHNQSKFGISMNQLDEVKAIEAKYNLPINGIHIHSSSVIMTPEVFLQGAQTVFDIALGFKNLEFIDFGGGIKVDVGDGQEVIDVVELGQKLDPVFQQFCQKYGRTLELWFEPGRFLVGNSGTLLTECKVCKRNGGTDFVGVDSGFNHLIRPMMYDAYHQIVNVSNPQGTQKKYTIVGNICEIDNLGKDRMLAEVREGDLIALESAGAYGYSMASTYNSRFRPAEVLVLNGVAKLIRKRDTYEDLMRNQVDLPAVDFAKVITQ